MKHTLVFGFGNPYRQDDGVAWHVLTALATRLGWKVPAVIEDEFIPGDEALDLVFDLQLTPELAEVIAGYQRVCFVDAHTGNIPDEISWSEVKGEYQKSPFTHHMTPSTCLAMAHSLYGKKPEAILVSIRGYEFGFTHLLSERTGLLVEPTVKKIWEWLDVSL